MFLFFILVAYFVIVGLTFAAQESKPGNWRWTPRKEEKYDEEKSLNDALKMMKIQEENRRQWEELCKKADEEAKKGTV